MAVPLSSDLKKQLGAIIEIAPNREVPMVKEAIEHGFYRDGISLFEAQKALLKFDNFKVLGEGLETKDVYNPHDFNKFLTGLMENKGALFEKAKLAFWNNDLTYLNPTLKTPPSPKAPTGELVPPRPTPLAPPPVTPSQVKDTPSQTQATKPVRPPQPQPRPASPPQTTIRETTIRKKAPLIQSQPQEQQLSSEQNASTPQPISSSSRQPKLNTLPTSRINLPRISKVSKRPSQTPRSLRLNPLPRVNVLQSVRSVGLNAASGSQILAGKGISAGLGGLGNILGRLPRALVGATGLTGGGGSPPSRLSRGGLNFFGRGRRGSRLRNKYNLRGLANKGIGKYLIILLLFTILFAVIGGLFGGQEGEGCPEGSVSINKRVTGATQTVDFYAVSNNQRIDYAISIEGECGQDFTIEDTLPANVDLITGSVTQSGTVEGKKITWKFPSLNSSITVSYSVTPNQQDTWVVNEAKIGFSISGGTVSPGGRIIDSQSRTFSEVLEQAAQNVNMPPALLKAILKTEAGAVLDYSEEEFIRFSTPGWWEGLPDNDPAIRRGYAYNTCADPTAGCGAGNDVRGVAQFELATWNGIKSQLQFADGHEPDRRNATDAIFGSGVLNRRNAESYAGTSDFEWTEDIIRAMARMYCAGPAAGKNPALVRAKACGWNGTMGYDDFVWRDYQIFSGQQ